MKPPGQISRRMWGTEFLWLVVASFIANVFVIILGLLQENLSFPQLVIRYIIIAMALAVYAITTAIKQYKCIFYLRSIYQELLKSNTIEQPDNKDYRLKVLWLAFIENIFSVVFVTIAVGLTGESKSVGYLLLMGIYIAFLFTIIFLPQKDLKYLKEMCNPHLDTETKEYILSFEPTWLEFLMQIVAMISIYLLVSLLF
jgi:hypothetical protein